VLELDIMKSCAFDVITAKDA